MGQDRVLVTARYSKLSVYDLPLQNLTETINGGYITWSVVVDPNNPRLAYVGTAAYISRVRSHPKSLRQSDLRRERPGFMAFSADGKYLLVGDNSSYSLDVIDVARQTLPRKVDLRPAIRTGVEYGSLGSIVVVGPKAYVTTADLHQTRSAIAAIDLRLFTVKSIKIPAGPFYGFFVLRNL